MGSRGSFVGRRRLVGLLAGVAVLAASTAVALAATPATGEIVVNTTAGDHDFAAVAMDANGNFISAFEDPDGSIAARRFNAAGSPLGGELPMSAPGEPSQEDANVAMDANGDAVVAWEDGASAEPDEIKARRISAGGSIAPTIIEVNTTTALDQDEPQVGMDADGNFVIVWEGNGPGDPDGVFMQRYTAAGVPVGGETRVNQTTVDTQGSAAVAMNASGEFVVAWEGPDGFNSDIFARRYTVAGAPVGPEFPVNDTPAEFANEPGAGIDADGNFVVAWYGEGAEDPDGGIFFRLFAPGGVPTTADMLANTTTDNFQGTSDRTGVSMDPGGNFVVAWEDDSGAEPGDVKLRRFDPAGAPLSAELQANTTVANNQRDARVATTANGDFVVAWEGDNAVPETDIVARLYTVPHIVPPDVTPPVLTLTADQKQKAGKPVLVAATCDEACLATGGGKVKVKGGGKASASAKSYELKPVSLQLPANQFGDLKLKLKRKEAKKVKKAVKAGAKAKAKVTVTAVDDAGNSAEGKKKVKLK